MSIHGRQAATAATPATLSASATSPVRHALIRGPLAAASAGGPIAHGPACASRLFATVEHAKVRVCHESARRLAPWRRQLAFDVGRDLQPARVGIIDGAPGGTPAFYSVRGIASITWAPDGQRLVALTAEGEGRDVLVLNGGSTAPRSIGDEAMNALFAAAAGRQDRPLSSLELEPMS